MLENCKGGIVEIKSKLSLCTPIPSLSVNTNGTAELLSNKLIISALVIC